MREELTIEDAVAIISTIRQAASGMPSTYSQEVLSECDARLLDILELIEVDYL